jgi:hypothetical protein
MNSIAITPNKTFPFVRQVQALNGMSLDVPSDHLWLPGTHGAGKTTPSACCWGCLPPPAEAPPYWAWIRRPSVLKSASAARGTAGTYRAV